MGVDSGPAEVNMQCWREPISTGVHTKTSLSRKSVKEEGEA